MLALTVAVAPPPEPSDRATWYGARCEKPYLGRMDTCSPYVARRHGGRGGELTAYAAMGFFRWGMRPLLVEVCSKSTGRCVMAVVRDYCRACDKGRALIDLSPVLFRRLGNELWEGVDRVSLRFIGAR